MISFKNTSGATITMNPQQIMLEMDKDGARVVNVYSGQFDAITMATYDEITFWMAQPANGGPIDQFSMGE